MRILKNIEKEAWPDLCRREVLTNTVMTKSVMEILAEVKKNGDQAVLAFTQRFDGVMLEKIPENIADINPNIPPALQNAIQLARENIERYHRSQLKKSRITETQPGVVCWWEDRPIEKVGLYIPGGSAPLFSTLLMLVIPAQLAGCKEIVVCSPPDSTGNLDPTIVYTAALLGLKTMYKVGGAQAIAAMAYGTESIPKVDKIFGPGNAYVTMAKQQVQREGIAIDMPAGPSEVLIIADGNSPPAFVAADLLSQAEHGPDSQVVLLTTDTKLPIAVENEIRRQKAQLPREKIVEKALEISFCVILDSLEDCFAFSNCYAPEHLILSLENAEKYVYQVEHAGSVFLGYYACESAGDYASGTNHTLPTSGFARAYSGVGVDSFQKRISFQQIDQRGLQQIGEAIQIMARAEGLEAHAYATEVRLNGQEQPPSGKHSPAPRSAIQKLKPYSSARQEFSGKSGIFLDANENPYGENGLNRYPDPQASELREKLAAFRGVSVENVFTGSGSDEVIDLLVRMYCEGGQDSVLQFTPTYGMYEVTAAMYDVECISVPLDADFQLDLSKSLQVIRKKRPKLIFVCSPNNPTGNTLRKADVLKLIEESQPYSLVVLDEAYIDFCPEKSMLGELKQSPNLVILQTFSKAFALAGIRLGMAYASREIIELLDRVKPPYNLSTDTQKTALKALETTNEIFEKVETIMAERIQMAEALGKMPFVCKIYPSEANYLLMIVDNARELKDFLQKSGLIIRDRSSQLQNALRISIGSTEENAQLIREMENYIMTKKQV